MTSCPPSLPGVRTPGYYHSLHSHAAYAAVEAYGRHKVINAPQLEKHRRTKDLTIEGVHVVWAGSGAGSPVTHEII